MPSFLDLDQEKGYSKFIEKLVEAKSLPLKQLEKDKSKEKLKIEVIDDLSKEAGALKKYADALFGLRSAFRKKKFFSENPSLLAGSAGAGSTEGEFNLEILGLAKNHRIASKPLKTDGFIPPGTFSLKIGDKVETFDFKGGHIGDFGQLIDKSKKKLLEFDLVKRDEGESVAILSSLIPGKKGEITLISDAKGILKQLNFFKKNTARDKKLIPANFRPKIKANVWSREQLTLSPLSREDLSLEGIAFDRKDTLNFTVSWYDLKTAGGLSPWEQVTDWAMQFNKRALIEFDELRFASESIMPFVQERSSNQRPSPFGPREKTNFMFLTLAGVSGQEAGKPLTKMYYLPDDFFDNDNDNKGRKKTISIMGEDFFGRGKGGKLNSLSFTNGNTSFEITIVNPTLGKEHSGKEFIPAQEITPAQNAKLKYQGVEVERENNQISDLIDGVTLDLKGTSKGEVGFKVDKDGEFVYGQLINFIGQFNICMGKMNMLLSPNPAPEDVEETDKRKYGLFKSEITFKLLRDKLRAITINPHPTSSPQDLTLLSQLGITSVFILGASDDPDSRKLDFEEAVYLETYESKPKLVAELFGYDNNGDLLIDSGVAFKVSQLVKGYVGGNSILTTQKNISHRRIKELDTQIEKKEKEIETYRAKQEKEFAKLQSAQKQMEKMQELLKNSIE